MICPYCKYETKVIDTRESNGDAIRRRRECLKCEKRFTTYERVEQADLIVVKKDGRRELFDRNKLKTGIMKACEKRPVNIDSIGKIVDEIDTELRKKDTTEISSRLIGQIIMKKLYNIDKIAYIRFASVYREFKDIKSFEKELRLLKK